MVNHITSAAVIQQSIDSDTLESPIRALAFNGVWYIPPVSDASDECLTHIAISLDIANRIARHLYAGNVHHVAALVSEFCRTTESAIDARQGGVSK